VAGTNKIKYGDNMENTTRYWLQIVGMPWQEATEEQFIAAERAAGFRPKSGTGSATGGFSGGGINGKITTGEITAERYGHDQEFLKAALAGHGCKKSDDEASLMKCPGCDLKLPKDDMLAQIQHMERCHPKIIAARHRAAGIRSEFTGP
jgi:hypothetical protein